MATYFARKSGNVNATDVWATTPTGVAGDFFPSFTSGDILISNSFTITINVNLNLGSTGEVRNDTTGGATAGGSFALSNLVTLTANVFAGTAANCVTLTGTASATIVGNITGGTSSSRAGVSTDSTGTLTVTGAVVAGTGSAAHGISCVAGNLVVTGNVAGGSSTFDCRGISFSGANLTVVGNCTGGSVNLAEGVRAAAGTVTITGQVQGGTNSNAAGVINVGAGSVTVVGTSVGAAGAGINNSSSGTVTVTRAKGGPLASSAVGVVQASITGSASVDEIEYGDAGASPTSGPIRLTDKTSNVCLVYRPSLSKKILLDLNSTSLLPSSSNVRSGIVYNAGQNTGSMNVPPAASVKVGVPVDNTVGTAALSPEDIWNVLTTNINTSGSIGERLKNCATIASVGQQLSDSLTIK